MTNPAPLDEFLAAAADGDQNAAEQLLPLVYEELRSLAASQLAKLPPGQTLQPTALVHEAYLKIAPSRDREFDGKPHFFFAAARAMRDIIVDSARRKASLKRGGDRRRVGLDSLVLPEGTPETEILAVHEALDKLEETHPEYVRLILLRYFVGLSGPETAEVLGISPATAARKWRFVRAWLQRELQSSRNEGS